VLVHAIRVYPLFRCMLNINNSVSIVPEMFGCHLSRYHSNCFYFQGDKKDNAIFWNQFSVTFAGTERHAKEDPAWMEPLSTTVWRVRATRTADLFLRERNLTDTNAVSGEPGWRFRANNRSGNRCLARWLDVLD
jgi:hypothetical protein